VAATATDLNAVISQKVEVAPGLIVLRVVPQGWELTDFVPGQYTTIGLPGSAPRCHDSDPEEKPPDPEKIIKRAYSIASSSVAKEYLEFYITLVRSGALTPRLFALNIGDRLWLSAKCVGFFTLDDVPADANVVLISTGTGLAPYVSMLRSHLQPGYGRRVAVIHGARHSWDLGYRSELTAMQRLSSSLAYIPVISRPAEEPVPWSGHTGYVQDIWNQRVLSDLWGFDPAPENTHVFLCGNPAMIEAMEEIIARDGFKEHKRRSPGQYHVERYW
jgi:ferredoxin--NADP+ reductase